MRAAFCAAFFNPDLPFVRTAFIAASCRDELLRRFAALCACRERLFRDAAERPSRLSAVEVARERLADGRRLRPDCPFARSRCACLRVRADAVPFFGVPSFTPERRAFDSPMAIACLVERAPCLPSWM